MFRSLKIIPNIIIQKYLDDIRMMSYFTQIEKDNIEKLIKRVFNTDDGKKVLAYMQYLSTYKTFNHNVSQQQLYFTEGQRAFVANIVKIVSTKK